MKPHRILFGLVLAITGSCGGDRRETTGETRAAATASDDASAAPNSTPAAEVLSKLRARFAAPPAQDAGGAIDPSGALGPGVASKIDIVSAGFAPQFTATVDHPGHVILPKRSSAPFHIEDADTGLAADVLMDNARDIAGEIADGYVVYREAESSGGTILQRPTPQG